MDRHAQTLHRINALMAATPPSQWNGFRPVELLVMRPSVDLATLVGEVSPPLPPSMRLLLGGLGAGDASPDWLSMLAFDPAYVERLIAIGEEDAERQAEALQAFLASEPS